MIDFSFFTDAAALRPNLSGEPYSEDIELLASVSMIAEKEICLCSMLVAAAAYPSGWPPSGALLNKFCSDWYWRLWESITSFSTFLRSFTFSYFSHCTNSW